MVVPDLAISAPMFNDLLGLQSRHFLHGCCRLKNRILEILHTIFSHGSIENLVVVGDVGFIVCPPMIVPSMVVGAGILADVYFAIDGIGDLVDSHGGI